MGDGCRENMKDKRVRGKWLEESLMEGVNKKYLKKNEYFIIRLHKYAEKSLQLHTPVIYNSSRVLQCSAFREGSKSR